MTAALSVLDESLAVLRGQPLSERRTRRGAPPWPEHGELRLPGAVIADVGLQLPLLAPGEAIVFEIAR